MEMEWKIHYCICESLHLQSQQSNLHLKNYVSFQFQLQLMCVDSSKIKGRSSTSLKLVEANASGWDFRLASDASDDADDVHVDPCFCVFRLNSVPIVFIDWVLLAVDENIWDSTWLFDNKLRIKICCNNINIILKQKLAK